MTDAIHNVLQRLLNATDSDIFTDAPECADSLREVFEAQAAAKALLESALVPIRIKTADVFGNVSYLYRRKDGSWTAALANGMGYCFHQAAHAKDEMALRFALENVQSAQQAIEVLRTHSTWDKAVFEDASSPPVEHKITLLWAERPDPGDEAKTYRFATKGEYDAFMLGVSEANGWINVREAPEGYVVPEPDDQTDEDEEILSAQMF